MIRTGIVGTLTSRSRWRRLQRDFGLVARMSAAPWSGEIRDLQHQASTVIPPDVVVDQRPAAGTQAAVGTTVDVIVSKGP